MRVDPHEMQDDPVLLPSRQPAPHRMFHRLLSYPSLNLGSMTLRCRKDSDLPVSIRTRTDLRCRSRNIAGRWLFIEQGRVDFDAIAVVWGNSVTPVLTHQLGHFPFEPLPPNVSPSDSSDIESI